jgi:hypothetical protein
MESLDILHPRQVLRGDTIEEFWALKEVSFEVQKGELARARCSRFSRA